MWADHCNFLVYLYFCMSRGTKDITQPASVLLSSQVGLQEAAILSQPSDDNPVVLMFKHSTVREPFLLRCLNTFNLCRMILVTWSVVFGILTYIKEGEVLHS